jgi:N-acetylneuraminate lyase
MRELKGIYPAIVTPLDKEGVFDPAAMRKIVQYQLQAGVHGFYVCGGTGEGMLLTVEERQAALEIVLDEVRGRAGVIAHIGAFQTADTLALARHACDVGVDAIAAIPPAYFYMPDTLGIVRYYTALSEASSVPVLAYNIPHRTGVKMTVDLFDQLLELPNIVGMKESSGDVYYLSLFFVGGKEPVIFQGEDTVLLPGLLMGACGGIGGSYNMWPHLFVKLWDAFRSKDIDSAAHIQLRINELINAFDGKGNIFSGIKQVLAWMGLECGTGRTPNRPLTDGETAALRRSLEDVGFFDDL